MTYESTYGKSIYNSIEMIIIHSFITCKYLFIFGK